MLGLSRTQMLATSLSWMVYALVSVMSGKIEVMKWSHDNIATYLRWICSYIYVIAKTNDLMKNIAMLIIVAELIDNLTPVR